MDYEVVIIGGGPAGLTAAIYASRARLKTLLVESYAVPCQAVTTDLVENFPGFPEGIGGFDLVDKFKKQAEKFGAEFIVSDVRGIKEENQGGRLTWKIETEDKFYLAGSIIIASGARPKLLGAVGEDKLRGKGVSYCATCDGALFKDKDVAVIGGGDSAIEEALFLTKFVNKLTIIHRRDALRAAKILQERAFSNKKISFSWDSVVTEISGDNKVSGVRIKNVKTNKEGELRCDGVFIFAGYVPNTDFVKGILELDDNGYIAAGEDGKTNKPGIFAAGDCRKKLLRQVVTACGDGAVAAVSCKQYLEKEGL
ncbi:MAG: thioredoxin-disulfide reductase [Candidatus Omnitrophota bacterium]